MAVLTVLRNGALYRCFSAGTAQSLWLQAVFFCQNGFDFISKQLEIFHTDRHSVEYCTLFSLGVVL